MHIRWFTIMCVYFMASHLQHWSELCQVASTAKWKKVDTHDGVTLSRCKFGRSSRGHAVIKIEGELAADPATVYQFLQLATKEGGKVCPQAV